MNNEIIKAVKQITSEKGIDYVVGNPSQIYNLLSDMVPDAPKERRRLKTALENKCVVDMLLEAADAPGDASLIFNKAVTILSDETDWSEEITADTISMLVAALHSETYVLQPASQETLREKYQDPHSPDLQIDGYEYDDEDYSRTWALEFRRDKDGYVISNYTAFGSESNVELPVRYKGERVVGIGDSAFANADIRSVKGNSIKRIGAGAFENCTLASFDFPNLVNIDDRAFDSCQRLTNIFLADSVESIGRNVFENINIGKIVLSKKLKEIEAEDLKKCAEIYVPGIKTEIKFEPKRFGTAGPYRTLGKDYIFPDGRRAVLTQKDLDRIINNYLEQSTIYCAINSRAYSFAKAYEIKCLPLPQNYRPL